MAHRNQVVPATTNIWVTVRDENNVTSEFLSVEAQYPNDGDYIFETTITTVEDFPETLNSGIDPRGYLDVVSVRLGYWEDDVELTFDTENLIQDGATNYNFVNIVENSLWGSKPPRKP